MSCELCGHRNEIQQGNYKLSRSVSVLERPAADQSPGNVWRRICIIAGLGLLYFTICLMTDTRTHTALLSPCLALLHFTSDSVLIVGVFLWIWTPLHMSGVNVSHFFVFYDFVFCNLDINWQDWTLIMQQPFSL